VKRKLYLETFGCQMNVLDSELVLGQLRAQGYESVEDPNDADVIIYNTCSVREHAEQKVWSRLGALRERKQFEPSLVIGVIGCMAERDGTNIFKRFPQVDVLCGPGELDKLPMLIHNAVVTNRDGASGGSEYMSAPPLAPSRRKQTALMGANSRRSSTLAAAEDHLELLDLSRSVSPGDDVTQAYVRITRGCNKFCTYCVVPYTRGPEVHRPPQNIVDEVRKLVNAGAKEVTLLGQTINHYNFAHGDGRTASFADLLYLIHESTPDLPRLRFVTSFPRDFSDEALQAMRDCPRICRYLHVPAQHGSDRILRLMNRGYTVGAYRDFIVRARAFMPDISIASDFIVGFPTETDEDFAQTIELVRECRFKNSFIFKYSPRPGTVAIEKFKDDVPEDIKRRRNNELLAVQQQATLLNNRAMIGKTVEVFVEGESKLVSRKQLSNVELGWESRRAGFPSGLSLVRPRGSRRVRVEDSRHETQVVGRTRGDQVVCFQGNSTLKGQILDVQITDAQNLTLFGKFAQPVTVEA
jgi:tRNA-2-methylthio-N6-dimethylallyladenosine synthase